MESETINVAARARILTEALPYIQKYTGKIVVIKYGGHAMVNEELKLDVMSDIILLSLVGVQVVLIHGGGTEITDVLKKLGVESRFVGGLRYTDETTMNVVKMVLSGKVNKDLVTLIEKLGGSAMGLCGVDGGMIKARKMECPEDLGFVGDVVSVNTAPILSALHHGYIPVIATMGMDEAGNVYNINADTAAAEIAMALQAENMLTLTDILGLMENVSDHSTLIPSVHVDEIDGLISRGVVAGGMIPKLRGLEKALRGGVKKAVMIDGRIPHSILIEMFTNEGIGTLLFA